MLRERDADGSWEACKEDWREDKSLTTSDEETAGEVWSVWSKEFVNRVSYSRDVESVIALGSVLAINLQDEHAGECSMAQFTPDSQLRII